ncbi:DUF3137 domain-containing protein [Haloplasma contractile]|uniref:Galanin protein n=1 Tax=Haloplasma contractile SSD-17B TaxID=1033810 RepID=U2DUF7_9MOLU|nr:DUF3137 domain-containing protein [Haloplasma contractile]ERJ12032.1 hypothetical protein HLPCO_001946 [Haloplasma contractile SSD-17B]
MNQDFSKFQKEKQLSEIITVIGYLILAFSFIFFIPLGSSSPSSAPVLMVFFALGGLVAMVGRKKFKGVSNKFKTEYLSQEIKKIYPDSTYDAYNGFCEHTVYGSHVLKKEDRYHSEDLINGTYEGVEFRSADVRLQDVRRSGKSTTVVTVFQGRVYEFEFNKRFKSNLLLTQPGTFKPFSSWKKVKTESNFFNSELKIYAMNEHEAFYILTPHFMERLLKLDRKYQDNISFSFINNKLYIAVNTKVDTFDLKMFNPINRSLIEDYKEQLLDIQAFIHELNLDQDLFAKD